MKEQSNKSGTPRTDAVDSAVGVSGDFARTLERELNEANRKLNIRAVKSLCHLFKGDITVGLEPELKTWEDAQEYCQWQQDQLTTALKERDEARTAHQKQRDNYTALYEAVLGDGCTTCDVKDIDAIAISHREVFERMNP